MENKLRKFDMISEINNKKETWKLAIRITDLWTLQYQGKATHSEGIFMDSKGDKIQVKTLNADMEYWKDTLKENMTYIIRNVTVKPNDLDYKACEHPFRLELTKGTSVKPNDFPETPDNVYSCKKFEEILAGKVPGSQLVDVIGEYHRTIYTQPNPAKNKVVIAIRILRKYPVSISNSMFGSKLRINENVPPISEFNASLGSCNHSESQSQGTTQMSSYSQQGLSEQQKFTSNAKVLSLADIDMLAQDTTFVTVGTIVKFFTASGWFYEGCFKCYKGRQVSNEQSKDQSYHPWTCGCGIHHVKPSLRYKLQVEVRYNNHSSKFVLWETEASKLLGITFVALRQQMIERGEDDPKIFPDALEVLIGQTLAFRCKAQPKFGSSVTSVDSDADFIQSLKKTIGINEEEETQTTFETETRAVLSEEDLQEAESATADHDPGLVEDITPAKRRATNKHLDDTSTKDVLSAQQSSTKIRKRIKKE